VSTATEILDEAYIRLHGTGPEWGGNLSNHGPMAAGVLARRGCAEAVPAWVDAYLKRLDEMPAATAPVEAKPAVELPGPPEASDPVAEVIGRACANGDEHVIKFTDTAASVYTRTGDPTVLAAAIESSQLPGSQT